MKKRIFMLALVVGVMLSVCASAWADGVSYYFKLGSTTYLGKEVVDKDTNTVRASFQVVLVYRTSSSAPSGYSKNANLVKWTISETEGTFNPTAVTIYRGTRTETESEESSFVTDPYYLTEIIDTPSETDTDVTATLTIETTGTMEDPSNTLSISVSLYKADTDGTELVTISTISSAQKDDSTSTTVAVDDTVNADTLDKRDPDSVFWNGLDPTFSNTINKTSYDIGKNKPKLGKIDKTKLTFTPNTASDLEIPMLGPIELVDVYIAEKDAKKLYPASADSISGNIRLTSASIKAYKIPFRVTATNFATTVSATGDTADKLKKAQAKAWKSAENTLTLAFNGSKMQYKGFPITIAMSNSNTSSKPVAKAIKLNIGDTFTTPSWTYMVTSRDKTTSLDVAEAKVTAGSWDSYSTSDKSVRVASAKLSGDVTAASWDLEIPADVSYDKAFKSGDAYYIIPEVFTVISTDGSTVVSSTDNTAKQYVYSTTWGREVAYYYCDLEVETEIDKKTKPEAVAAVYPDAATPYADEIPDTYFYASGDAPYAITMKPGLSDTDKLGKFFKTNDIEVVQPVYDYLGNVKTNGYVKIAGVPTNTAKESKLALTLTATNPSTKKKAAAKVTAMGKLVPTFDKTTTISDTKWITTKRVQAGKAPSVKPKAKGSKTITYHLGEYYLDGDTLYDVNEGDDDYSYEALAAKLAAVGLSFDAKKGIVAIEKNKTYPTLNEEGDAFESLDIPITAANNVGTDLAYAAVAITGAKPAVVGKEVTFALTDKPYTYKTFDLKAGKDTVNSETAGANVKATENTEKGEVLSTYGLKMVTYDELLAGVKSTDTVAAGTEITKTLKGWTPSSSDYAVVSGSVKPIENASGDTTGYTASTDVVMYNGKYDGVLSPDESLKNKGIIQIVNYTLFTTKGDAKTAKGVKVTVALENLGAAGKGSVKVKVPAAATSSNGALPASLKALANNGSNSAAAAKKTNGTASLTYNGALPDEADDESAEDVTVTVGEPRTVADLTAGQQAYLAAKGLKVIAVLPEISATADGQQEFAVELDEDAPEGAKMVYVPFPQDVEETDDDKIADFYGADGEAIEEVPAEKDITVAPWLRADVVYQPVIAVEAE